MAHNLDFSKGSAAFASFKTKAWHGLGHIFETLPETVEEFAAAAGLDYEIGVAPNIHRIPGTEVDLVSETSFFTYRKDNNAVLGDRLSQWYSVLQNREVVEIIESFFKEKKVTIETAGAIAGGRRIFISCKMTDPIVVGKDDVVDNYFLITTAHDGTGATKAFSTPVRVVCENTLQMSLNGCQSAISIMHMGDVQDRMKKAFDILMMAESNAKAFEAVATKMAKTKWTDTRFKDYVANVFCSADEIKAISAGAHPMDVLSKQKQNTISQVLEYAETGPGQELSKGTAWSAYNAVTGYFSNIREYKTSENRYDSLLFGTHSREMAGALTMAAAPINNSPIKSLSFGLN